MLESYVTKTRDRAAAPTFMKKALKRHGSPGAITTDGLRSHRAATNELGVAEKQEVGRRRSDPERRTAASCGGASGRLSGAGA